MGRHVVLTGHHTALTVYAMMQPTSAVADEEFDLPRRALLAWSCAAPRT